ncbi:ribosomal protein L49/IMG2, partial [Entophlyctis helioformis]
YSVERRPQSGWLPVYSEFKAGGTQQVTLVRGIRGDIQRLVADLGEFIPPARISTTAAGTKVSIVGDYRRAIKDWLTERAF